MKRREWDWTQQVIIFIYISCFRRDSSTQSMLVELGRPLWLRSNLHCVISLRCAHDSRHATYHVTLLLKLESWIRKTKTQIYAFRRRLWNPKLQVGWSGLHVNSRRPRSAHMLRGCSVNDDSALVEIIYTVSVK